MNFNWINDSNNLSKSTEHIYIHKDYNFIYKKLQKLVINFTKSTLMNSTLNLVLSNTLKLSLKLLSQNNFFLKN